jgi:hypothetical protein
VLGCCRAKVLITCYNRWKWLMRTRSTLTWIHIYITVNGNCHRVKRCLGPDDAP